MNPNTSNLQRYLLPSLTGRGRGGGLLSSLAGKATGVGLLLLLLFGLTLGVSAQPAKRRSTTTQQSGTTSQGAAAKATTPTSDRAALMFPTNDAMPEELVWRRDIYRQLDLTKDANAPLYYPTEPRGKEQNLFTYIFRLMLSGRISVYEYKIDGNESFEEADKIKLANIGELLDRYHINFETDGGRVTVLPVDIPSALVKRFDVKEQCYFDQRSATFKRRVTALCPVLMDEFSAGDIGDEGSSAATSYPLFWVKYDDVAPYLSRMPLMASNLNNVTNMTVDDFFTLNRYEGKIYKTNNLQGRVLANYCKTDSAMQKEQARIEKELTDFEQHIWTAPQPVDTTAAAADSLNALSTGKGATKATRRKGSDSSSSSRRSKSSSAAAKKPKSSGGNSAPRVSARRQRR